MKFRSFIYALLMVVFGVAGFQSVYAATYADDTLAVRQILDAGGKAGTSAVSVTEQSNSRVSKLTVDGLDTLIASVSSLDSLKELVLTSHGAIRLPNEVGDLPVLKILRIKRSDQYKYIPMNSTNLTSLEVLEISNCDNFENAPSYIASMTGLRELNLEYTGISSLDAVFGNLTNLEILRVNNTKLTQLPADISTCTSLRELYISNTFINYLPPEIGDLSNLEKIYCWVGSLKALPPEIGRLKKLKNLTLDYNEITSLPDSIGGCSSLEILHCSGNQISAIGDGVCNLEKLTSFYLNNNKIETLPDSIGKLKTVKTLLLSENPLRGLPPGIGGMDSLQIFQMEKCSLTTLPEEFGQLKSIETLYLKENQLESLPGSFGNLSTLRILHLTGNRITSLPANFGALSSLELLKLSNNLLTDGVSEISDLPSLTNLEVRNNRLKNLSYGVVLQQLYADSNEIDTVIFVEPNSLKKLHLSNNNLSSINWQVLKAQDDLENLNLSNNNLTEAFSTHLYSTYLQKLKVVNLSNNRIEKISDSLHILTVLDSLDLSNNSLDSLPGSISRMNMLRYLFLGGNSGFKITDSLTHLSTLWQIDLPNCDLGVVPGNMINLNVISCDLSGNNLSSVNDSLFMMPNLRYLSLAFNNLTEIPGGVAKAETFFESLYLNDNEIKEIPDWFCLLSHLKRVDVSRNYISELPDTIKNLAPAYGFLFEENKICDPFSDSVQAWISKYDHFGHRFMQNCDIPENPFTLTSSLVNDSVITLSWDTSSVNDTDLEFSRILFRTDTFSIDAEDRLATELGKYDAFQTFADTLSPFESKKRYYFSIFAGDSVDEWSEATAAAQTIISTHELNLYDSTGGSENITVSLPDSITGSINIYYKLLNTDSLDKKALINMFYRNGVSGSWNSILNITGAVDSVTSMDISEIKVSTWNLKNEFGNDFVSDSLQIMITAEAELGLKDTLMMAGADLKVDLTDLPESISNLKAVAISESQIVLSWNKSTSFDVDSQFICFNTDGTYPQSVAGSSNTIGLGKTDTNYTASLLNEKTWHNFILLARDSSGNYSAIDSGSQASARTFDVTPSDEIKNVLAAELSHNSAKLKWLDPDSTDAVSILYILSMDSVKAVSDTFSNMWNYLSMDEDSVVFSSLTEETGYYAGFFVIDSSNNISAGEFLEFTTSKLGNLLPEVSVSDISGEQSGDVSLRYTLSDSNHDTLGVRFKYSTDGINWDAATVSGDTSGIAYEKYNGVTLNGTWHSAVDLEDFNADAVYLVAVPYDPANGVEDTTIIDLDNYHNQKANVTSPIGSQSGDITFFTSVADTSGDMSSLTYYYSLDNGSIWLEASNITVSSDSVVWHTDSVFKNINVSNIQFKVVANDGWQDGIAGITDTFSVQNLTTYMTGDYNEDGNIDFGDFSYVASYWNLSAGGIKDPIALNELAPYSGTAPYLSVVPDSVYDHKDLGAFLKMYYWSKENRGAGRAFAANRSFKVNTSDIKAQWQDSSTISLSIGFKEVEEIVACRYRVKFDESRITMDHFTEGEFLKRGGASLLKLSELKSGALEVGMARISSEEFSVSEGGVVSEVVFNNVEGGSHSFVVEYELINSNHEVVESRSETINLKDIDEDHRILSAIPTVSRGSDNRAAFEILYDAGMISEIANNKDGIVFRVDLTESSESTPDNAELKIYNNLGDEINSIFLENSNFYEKVFIYWSGHDYRGYSLASGAYSAVLFYNNDGIRKAVKRYVGIEK